MTWLIHLSAQWPTSSDRTNTHGFQVWTRGFPINATELDVWHWAWRDFTTRHPLAAQGTVTFYRAVPNTPTNGARP